MSEAQPAQPKKRRTGLIILLVVLGVLLALIAGCAVLVGVVFTSAGNAVDPAKNAATGLADGSYTMTPSSSAVLNDQCSFSGPVYDLGSTQVADDVSVVGRGPACVHGTDTKVVAFTVTSGIAEITAAQ